MGIEKFHVEISGLDGGQKLVFLHGLMGSASNFIRIARAFEGDHTVLRFDQRGHGRSHKPAVGYAPENYADDLQEVLEILKWDRIRLVGHSMGGRNALNFASRFPERVEKLVIEDIGPDINPIAVSKIESLIASVPTPFETKAEAREHFLKNFADQTLGQYLYTNIIEISAGKYDWRFSVSAILESVREGRLKDRWDEIDDLQMPTLLVRGEQTEDLSREVYQECLRRNAFIRGVEIPQAGHWVHFDKPDLFIEALRGFFEGQ